MRGSVGCRGAVGLIGALALVVLFPQSGAAQITGRVTTADGRPAVEAVAELWSGGERRASTRVRGDGTFILAVADTMRLAKERSLIVRSIGFRPVSRPIVGLSERQMIVLERLPQLLEEVSVSSARVRPLSACERRPSSEASTLYARAASFYRDDTRWLDRIARYTTASRGTEEGERESFVGVAQRGGWTRNAGLYDGSTASNGSAVPRELSAEERLALPFPVPERKKNAFGRIVGWVYPRFWEWGSPSFVSKAFVDSMPKAIVSSGSRGTVIAFCPRERKIPYVYGEIQLAADTTIAAVRWWFAIERPGEETGGTALFAPPSSRSVRVHLLPITAITWTRLPRSERFETTEYAYGPWAVAEFGMQHREVPPE